VFGLELLGPIAFDPCAGAEPGSTPADDCGAGYAATFDGTLGLTPPRPFMFVNPGHWPTGRTPGVRGCPSAPPASDTAAEMMLSTHTPLSEAHFRYRPYGSDDAWVDVDIGATPADEVAWWNGQLASADFDVIESMLMTCFSVAHDPNIPYEYEAWGIDVYGRLVVQDAQPRFLAADDPSLRPVATAEISGLTPVANVKAWAPFGGFVTFRWKYVDGADASCDGAYTVPESQLVSAIGRPQPPGLYDPQYSVGAGAAIPLLPGRTVLVCADIHPDDNPFRVAFTDRLLLNAPSLEQPRIVLQSVRRAGDVTIPNGRLGVSAGEHITTGRFGDCDGGTGLPELAPGRTHTVEQLVWGCAGAAVPVDRDGNLTVPVRVTRTFDPGAADGRRTIEVGIPIHVTDCRLAEGCRGREWFEVPIPVDRGGLCGSSFGLGCDPPNDGILVFRVDYPVVAGAGGADGSVTVLDAVVPEPSDTTRISPPIFNQSPGNDPFHSDLAVSLVTDRPVQITFIPVELLPDGVVTACAALTPVVSEGFSERPSVVFDELCRGRVYGFDMQVVDETGARQDLSFRDSGSPMWFRFANVSARTQVALQTFGGESLATLGYFADVQVRLDGAQQTNYWWNSTTLRQGSAPACLALNGTTFTPNGATAAPYFPDGLTVEVSVRITTTGESDCSGRPSSGLGVVSFTTVLTPEQLLSDELVIIDSPPDSLLRLQLRVSFGDWRPDGPDSR